MRRKNHTHQQDIDDLKKQNALLEQQGEWRNVSVFLTKCDVVFLPGCAACDELCFFLLTCCSSSSGESQGEHSAPDKLLFWQQLVHKPQRECGIRLRWRLRLQLWIRARRAAQQKEAACGAQLGSHRPPNLQTDSLYPPAPTPLTCPRSVLPSYASPGDEVETVWERCYYV